MPCFERLFFCPEAASFVLRVCIYHINPPGHENFAIVLAVGSCFDCPDDPVLPVNDLSDSLRFSTFLQND